MQDAISETRTAEGEVAGRKKLWSFSEFFIIFCASPTYLFLHPPTHPALIILTLKSGVWLAYEVYHGLVSWNIADRRQSWQVTKNHKINPSCLQSLGEFVGPTDTVFTSTWRLHNPAWHNFFLRPISYLNSVVFCSVWNLCSRNVLFFNGVSLTRHKSSVFRVAWIKTWGLKDRQEK